MMNKYAPTYSASRALVIGINKYEHASPLSYARNDAEAVRNALIQRFGFKPGDITSLFDGDATYGAIRKAFLHFANSGTDYDDRLVVFFAGHGHTITGRRGEIGYLVPSDGHPEDLSTLLRWDDLTKNGDLIRAKHMLYIMDACYGGLALTRALQPGSKRFLKDMLTRHSRQVITAGKADEVVADSGGPRPGHSVFTGHLLEALETEVIRRDGPVTANKAMAYVYHKVGGDSNSSQTPHFGFIDGDGDFIFDVDVVEQLSGTGETEQDILVSVAPFPEAPDKDNGPSTEELVKEYLAEPRFRIRLDDLFSQELRTALGQIAEVHADSFREQPDSASFIDRITRYGKAVASIQRSSTLLARWGNSDDHRDLLKRVVMQLSPTDSPGGFEIWADLRWFPVLLVMFGSGVGSVAQSNYFMLEGLFSARAINPWSGESKPLLEQMLDGWRKVLGTKLFSTIPGYEKNYVPDREYIFKHLQPSVEDLLFIGLDYESAFDRFEALLALSYLDQTLDQDDGSGFALPGRYAYKRRRNGDQYASLLADAVSKDSNWSPVRHGVFASVERFKDIHARHEKFIERLHW